MQVKDIMTRDVISIAPDGTIAQAIAAMLDHHVSGLPVVDAEGRLVGILSEGDLLRRVELGTEKRRARLIEFLLGPGQVAADYVHSHGRKVEEVMTRDLVTVGETASLREAVDLMNRHKVKRLPVVQDGRPIGMITRADLLAALSKLLPSSERTMTDAQVRTAVLAELDQQKWAPIAWVDVDVRNGVVEFRGSITDERQRDALHVLAENVPGVKGIRDHLVWIEPNSGLSLPASEDQPAEEAHEKV